MFQCKLLAFARYDVNISLFGILACIRLYEVLVRRHQELLLQSFSIGNNPMNKKGSVAQLEVIV